MRMVRSRPGKKTDAAYVSARLAVARAYLKDARNSNEWADLGDLGNPSIATSITCAIAYADAITAKYRGEINQGDHAAVIKLLRAALGNAFPKHQEANLRTLLEQKDEVQYGVRTKSRDDAAQALVKLEDFAAWAETQLLK